MREHKKGWTTVGLATLAVLTASPPTIAKAQAIGASAPAAMSVLAQLSTAFSGSNAVQKVQLSGTATLHAGSLMDTGAVTLTASPDGSSQTHLSFETAGQRTETQTGTGMGATCQWANADGVVHQIDFGNCLQSTVWFLPSYSLQPALLQRGTVVSDLGIGTVGSSADTYRHLQSQTILTGFPDSLASDFLQRSRTDLGFDPVTSLPAVLAYTVYPDSGAQTPIAIEIRYADYRAVNGVQIPFSIQRYVSGSLQLDIALTSAQIN